MSAQSGGGVERGSSIISDSVTLTSVSQVELARRLAKTQPFISYLERGERRFDLIEFYAIAKALGVDPQALFAEVVGKLPDQVEI